MKKFLLLTALSFLVFACNRIEVKSPENPVYAETPSTGGPIEKMRVSQDFVQGSEDIPLLEQMDKMFDEGLGFDSASGSIMSSSYESKIELERVRSFYAKTLPQMGWKLLKNDSKKSVFEREKDKLEIEFVKQGKQQVVKFFISSDL
ncbi:MAG: hypothetical protein KA100_07150 [Rickettsiales bacterium]|nr:hypothetical protein [Rickettsiales bacterium]